MRGYFGKRKETFVAFGIEKQYNKIDNMEVDR